MTHLASVFTASTVLLLGLLLPPDAAALQDGEGRMHPTPENIPADDEVDLLLTRSMELTPEMVALLEPMDGGPILAVGDDEVEEEFLSRVSDALVSGGRLFVLDEQQSTVRVFGLADDTAYSIGGQGQGPAEFMRPTGMDVSSDGDLIVTDAFRRIQRLTPDDGTQIEQITTDFGADDICIIDDRLFAQGYRESEDEAGHVLFEMDWQGQILAEHAPGYASDHPMARSAMSEGALLSCDSVTETLVVAYPYMPVIKAWDATGRQQWQFKIDGFIPFSIQETMNDGRPGIRYSIPEKLGHIVMSLDIVAPGFTAIGVAETGSEARAGGRDTWLFSMDGTRAGYAGQMSEYPVYGDQDYLVTLENFPAPVVRVYAR